MEGSANERLDFGKMGYGIIGEDARLELPAATKSSIVVIVTMNPWYYDQITLSPATLCQVPADGIIISGHCLAIDESSMTGESKILCSSNNELYSFSQALVRTHMVWKKGKKRIRRVRCTCYFPSHCRHP